MVRDSGPRSIRRFALGAETRQAPVPRRSLLLDGVAVAEVPAAAIDAQFALPDGGFLLVLGWDTPFEETPWLLLLDAAGRQLDRHEFSSIGGLDAAGMVEAAEPRLDGALGLRIGGRRWRVSVTKRGLLRPRLRLRVEAN